MNIPLDEWSGSKATKELQASIERIERENAALARRNYIASLASAAFAFLALVVSLIQLWK
jgi:hypothetical protein